MRQIERYVMVELLRVFMVLITISSLLFVFIAVFTEAQKQDLGFEQVIQIMPYSIPSLLPYTIPATLLLSVCVVYGRMAGDSEIIAVRAAGIHIMHLMWPAFFIGASLSVITLFLTDQVTPWAFHRIEKIITLAVEDIFLDKLRTQNQISSKEHGVTINVTGVKGRTLIEPTIRFTQPGSKPTTITAELAYIEFDLKQKQVWLTLKEMQANLAGKSSGYSKKERIAYALPTQSGDVGSRVLQTQELLSKLKHYSQALQFDQERESIEVAFALARGDFEALRSNTLKTNPDLIKNVLGEMNLLRTEIYNRFAMSVSGFFVVLLGTPFAILMAKRQFLTSFLFCFLPILTIYYPIVVVTQNMSKSGYGDPIWTSWIANGVLLIAAIYNIRLVMRN